MRKNYLSYKLNHFLRLIHAAKNWWKVKIYFYLENIDIRKSKMADRALAIMPRVCSKEIKVYHFDITVLLLSLRLKPNQCQESNSNGFCASEQLVPTMLYKSQQFLGAI